MSKVLLFLQDATKDEIDDLKKHIISKDTFLVTNNYIEDLDNYKCLYSNNVETTTYRLSLFLKYYQPDIIYTNNLEKNKIVIHARKMSNLNSLIYVEENKKIRFDIKLLYNLLKVDKIIISRELLKNYKFFNKRTITTDKLTKNLFEAKIVNKIEKIEDVNYEYEDCPNVKYFIDNGGKIGVGCKIYPSVHFGSEPYLIEIGDNVRITDWVKFLNHDGGIWTLRKNYEDMEHAYKYGKIKIGDNTHIGWNTIIMPGVKIGKNCVIGCGAIVTHDIPDNSIAVGMPAKVIKTLDEYYEKNKNEVIIMQPVDASDIRRMINNNDGKIR